MTAAKWSRDLAPGQVARIIVANAVTGESRIVHVSDGVLFEAPNWTADGDLVVNGDGVLWRLPATGETAPVPIPIDVPELNNDHVLAPDGSAIYLSANDGHLYRASLGGGPATRLTSTAAPWRHFLHGVSPDGSRLSYVALRGDPVTFEIFDSAIRTVATDGSDDTLVYTGDRPVDGPEYSPDGEWIYFNTEQFTTAAGHAQIARVRPGGGEVEQLTDDERVNWFPHFAPTGPLALYLSFPPGTIGHPADLRVRLMVVADGDWAAARTLVELDGGQGTINVNGWAPDGVHFAYVDYPFGPEAQS